MPVSSKGEDDPETEVLEDEIVITSGRDATSALGPPDMAATTDQQQGLRWTSQRNEVDVASPPPSVV